jgi:hypothetical protein
VCGTFSEQHVVRALALIHVPRLEQPALLRAIARWLRPGGLLVVSLTVHDDAGSIEQDWMGAPMYWSGFDAATNRAGRAGRPDDR